MKYVLLSFILIACGKGNHTYKKPLNIDMRYGTSDPCKLGGPCDIVDVLNLDDPYIGLKFQKYFPNFDFNQSGNSQYKVGQTYFLNKEEHFNQSYDFQTQKFLSGCLIRFQEKRIIYRIKEGLVDDEGENFSEILYKYQRSNPKNLTPTEECRTWLEDSFEFNEDASGWDTQDITESRNLEIDLNEMKEFKNDPNNTIHLFVVNFQGEFLIRRHIEMRNQKVETSLVNPDTGEAEDIVTMVDTLQLAISRPNNNTLGNFYEFTLYKADGELVQAAQHKLENLHQSNIDPSEIPEDSL